MCTGELVDSGHWKYGHKLAREELLFTVLIVEEFLFFFWGKREPDDKQDINVSVTVRGIFCIITVTVSLTFFKN